MERIRHRQQRAAAFSQGEGADMAWGQPALRYTAGGIVAKYRLSEYIEEIERLAFRIPYRPLAQQAAVGVNTAYLHGSLPLVSVRR
jgi:hypothetical protein